MSRKCIIVLAMLLVALLGVWGQAQTVVFENLTDWQSIKSTSVDISWHTENPIVGQETLYHVSLWIITRKESETTYREADTGDVYLLVQELYTDRMNYRFENLDPVTHRLVVEVVDGQRQRLVPALVGVLHFTPLPEGLRSLPTLREVQRRLGWIGASVVAVAALAAYFLLRE